MRLINRTPHTVTIVQPVCPRCRLPRTSFEPGAIGIGAEDRCPQCGSLRSGKPERDGVFIRLAPEPPAILVEESVPEPVAGNFAVTLAETRGWAHESTTAAAAEINKAVEDNDGFALVIVPRMILEALAQRRAMPGSETDLAIDRALLAAAAPDTSPASAVHDEQGQIIGVRRLLRRAVEHTSG